MFLCLCGTFCEDAMLFIYLPDMVATSHIWLLSP